MIGLRGARKIGALANVGGAMYTGAVFFAVRVALDARVAKRWLPPGVSIARPAVATVFAAHFPETSFGSVYDEAGIFFHVRRRLRGAVFCPWMVVTDDVALIVGRELCGYPKKLARVTFAYDGRSGGVTHEGSEVHAEVERRGRVVLTLRGVVGARVSDAPPMLGQRALNVRGALGLTAQRLVTFTPRETIREVRSATAEIAIGSPSPGLEEGRDPLDALGLGTVVGAHLYRVDVAAGLPPREVRRAGLGFALRSVGARWL